MMLIEVGYSYQEDKKSTPVNSWAYFQTKCKTFDSKCVTEANKHFKQFASSNGWTRKCKLKTIQLIDNEKTFTPMPPSARNSSNGGTKRRSTQRKTRASTSSPSQIKNSKKSVRKKA